MKEKYLIFFYSWFFFISCYCMDTNYKSEISPERVAEVLKKRLEQNEDLNQPLYESNSLVNPLLILVMSDENNALLECLLQNPSLDLSAEILLGNILHRTVNYKAPKNLETVLTYLNAHKELKHRLMTSYNLHGLAPLHCAMQKRLPDCTALLLAHGTSSQINHRDKKSTSLHLLLSQLTLDEEIPKIKEIITLLSFYGANFNAKDDEEITPLQYLKKYQQVSPGLDEKLVDLETFYKETIHKRIEFVKGIIVLYKNHSFFFSLLPLDVIRVLGNYILGYSYFNG